MDFDLILPKATITFFEQHVPNFSEHIDRIESTTSPAQRYPDGALQLHGEGAYDALNLLIQKHDLDIERGHFRSLSKFPKRFYQLWYTKGYQRRLGQRKLNIVPAGSHPESADEQRLEQ